MECKCKDNVGGKFCDTCKDFHYNLQFNNPQGCRRCTCSELGTNSQLKNCDKVSGQCSCKSRVNGLACSVCKDGSTDLRDYSIFGCKGKTCVPTLHIKCIYLFIYLFHFANYSETSTIHEIQIYKQMVGTPQQ